MAMSSTAQRYYRILLVTGVYATEKTPHAGTFIKSQADSLIAAGHEVELIHPNPDHPVPVRYATTAVQVFLRTLTGRFDVVHGHFGLWCLAARLQWTTPVVASFLGEDLLGEPCGEGRYSRKGAFVVRVSRWLCRVVDAVIVKSEEMKRATWKEDVFVIPNGVDFELFRPIPRAEARAALGWDQDRYYVLFGGNPYWPRKRFYLAQAAIECLRAKGLPVELMVAYHLPQTQVVECINASNAVILPSIHEGSPNFVKETMACNVPVVATDVGDVAQLIGRTTGCKVCPDEPAALAAALEEAFLQTEPTTGRKDIAHLECSKVALQIIAVYEQAMKRKKMKKTCDPVEPEEEPRVVVNQ